jgi:hypothetical protein
MTVVAERLVENAPSAYGRKLPSGVAAIAAVSGGVALWSLLLMATLSAGLGLAGLLLAGAIAYVDAEFATPTRIDMSDAGITLGYWHRTKAFAADALVVTHDVRRNHFSIRRRGKKRVLARFRSRSASVVRTFVAAGVEIESR